MLNLRWSLRHVCLQAKTDVRALRALIQESAPYWAFGVFFMIYLWVDTVMLSLMAAPADVAWYGVATRLFTTLMFVPVILSMAWLPSPRPPQVATL